jgi:hypothetical protein
VGDVDLAVAEQAGFTMGGERAELHGLTSSSRSSCRKRRCSDE